MTRNSPQLLDTWLGPGAPSVDLRRGQLAFAIGEPVERLFRVRRGRLRLERVAADGKVAALALSWPGDLVAEASLFSSHYHCDGVAESRAELAYAPITEAREHFDRTARAWEELARLLAGRLQAQRTLSQLHSLRRAEDRILGYLDLGWPTPEDRPLRSLAFDLGLTEPAFYRALARLVEAGRVEREGSHLALPEC